MITGNPTWLRPLHGFAIARQNSFRPGQNGNAGALHGSAGFFLFAHQPGDFRGRADELDIAGLGDFREVGIFRQQAVAGMDRVHVGDFRRADHRREY